MAKYEWSEVFMSIEGEARYSGHPTIYVRFARCNFQCRGFNNPTNDVQPDGYATLGFEPKAFKTIHEIPLIHRGCDSQYAVNPEFAHMWGQGDEKQLAKLVIDTLPHNTFVNPETRKRVILSLTGGEPTIRLKFWIPLLEELYQHGMRSVLIETNCAAPLRKKDMEALYIWAQDKYFDESQTSKVHVEPMKFIWSNSPKLRSSGEEWNKAIRPEIAVAQRNPLPPMAPAAIPRFEQYFKFVCGPTDEDFNEVKQAMEAYYAAGISRSTDVYIMPVACTEEQQQEIASKVAHMCMDKGYIYCHRIQNSVFGNGVGT
jgi:7-carboxy-7-deazaguanine synthase